MTATGTGPARATSRPARRLPITEPTGPHATITPNAHSLRPNRSFISGYRVTIVADTRALAMKSNATPRRAAATRVTVDGVLILDNLPTGATTAAG